MLRSLSNLLIRMAKKYSVLLFLILAYCITSLFYFDVVFQGRTLLTPGKITAGVMGDIGAYGIELDQRSPRESYAVFFKDFGSNAWAGEPQVAKVNQMIRQWTLPLWNDNVQMGKPLAANFLSDPFYPLKIILYIFPNTAGWDFYLLTRFAIGVFFMILFLRKIGVRAFPAIVGGVAFAFSGYFVLLHNIQNLDVDLIVPVMFWVIAFIMRLVEDESMKWYHYLIAIFTLVAILLSNIPQSLLLVLTAGFTYLVYRLIRLYRKKGIEQFRRALVLSLWIVIPAGLIVLPLYLINAEFVRNSFTLHTEEAEIGLSSWIDPHAAVENIFPYFQGLPFLLPKIASGPNTLNYIGLTGFFLVILGAMAAFRHGRSWLFILVFGAIAFGKIYGWSGINELIGSLPGYGRVLYMKYTQPLLSFSAAALISFGLDALLRKKLGLICYIIGVFLYGFLLVVGVLAHPTMNFNESSFSLFTAIILLLVIVVGFTIVTPTPQRCAGVALLGMMVATELWLLVPREGRPERYESFTKPPFVAFLQQQEKPFRIFAFNRLLYPEISSAFDLDDIRDLDALFVDRYYTYIKEFISPSVYDRFTGMPESTSESEPVRFIDNPFFDLLNVKYILALTPPTAFFPESSLTNKILSEIPPRPDLREMGFSLNSDQRRALLAHAPNAICTILPVSAEKPLLRFSTGIDETAWDYPFSDGVDYRIQDGAGKVLFSSSLDPTNIPEHRRWFDHTVDLSSYSNTEPTICFITEPRSNSAADLSGWANLRLTAPNKDELPLPNDQYRLIYDDEIFIYENTESMPRGFLVGGVTLASSPEEVVTLMKDEAFNPRVEAVVTAQEGVTFPEMDGDSCTTGGIENYQRPNPHRLSFIFNSPGNCFLVWTDTEYPGWIAKVDGRRQKISQTDLLFRGLFVTQGSHTVEFIYRPITFYGGLVGTVAGIIAILMWIIRSTHLDKKKGVIR